MGTRQTTALHRRGQAAAGSAQAEEGRAARAVGNPARLKDTEARNGSELGDGRRLDEPAGDGGATLPSGFADAALVLAGVFPAAAERNGTERSSGRDQDCSA
jgi:hypothetical protein